MLLQCLLLPWTNTVLTAVVNKLISMLFLRRVSWAWVNHREAYSGRQGLVKLSSRTSRRDLLFLSITAAAAFSFYAVLIMLFLLLSSLIMIKSERGGLLFSLGSIIAWRHSCKSVFILFLVLMLYRSDGCSFLFLLWIAQGMSWRSSFTALSECASVACAVWTDSISAGWLSLSKYRGSFLVTYV